MLAALCFLACLQDDLGCPFDLRVVDAEGAPVAGAHVAFACRAEAAVLASDLDVLSVSRACPESRSRGRAASCA